MSGVLPTVPMNPSRMSMPRLLEGAAPLYGLPQHYRAAASEGKPRLPMSAAFHVMPVGLEVPELWKRRTLPTMAQAQASELFSMADAERSTGLWPAQLLRAAVHQGHEIQAAAPFADDQIQPASLDLRLGAIAYRVRASFLPGPGATVARRIEELKLHEIVLSNGAVLETGCVYIVPLLERLALPDDIAAAANPKSSTGRLDVFTRVIADETRGFDRIRAGYHGPLYAEISPKTFPVLVREGARLSQIRFRHGNALVEGEALRAPCARAPGRRRCRRHERGHRRGRRSRRGRASRPPVSSHGRASPTPSRACGEACPRGSGGKGRGRHRRLPRQAPHRPHRRRAP